MVQIFVAIFSVVTKGHGDTHLSHLIFPSSIFSWR